MKFSDIDSRFFARVAGVALLYFFAAVVGLQFAVVGSTVTLVWPSSGIALVAVLAFGYRMALGIALGALFANVWMGLPMLLAGGIALGNTLEAVMGTWLLTCVCSRPRELYRHRDVFALIVLAAMASTALGAVLGVGTLTLGGIVPFESYASVWVIWWLGDMMGVLMVAPPLLIWLSQPPPLLSRLQSVEALLLLVLLLTACSLIFGAPELAGHGYYPASLAVIPFVVWGALRFEYFGAALVTLLISALAAWGTAHGTGPFVAPSMVGSLVGWSIFANLMAMTGLLLAVSSAGQRHAQSALLVALRDLTLQKGQAEQANRDKSNFIAVASHDLRQPMHAIALYVAALQPTLAGRAAAATLDKIESAVTAMENMCSAVLDVSRLEAGAVVPNIACVPVQSLLDDLYNDFCHQASSKGLQLRLRYVNAVASSDPVLLVRILRNLIANALRYTEHGGVLVSARRRQGAIRFQVWDTGWGIAPEHTASIFREYFQVRRAQRSGHFGQGLGLFIVAQLTRLLGHPLTVRSYPGRGTVFSVDVPLCREDHRTLAMAPPLLPGIGQLHGQVWILDDDVAVLDALKGLLGDWGLHVAKATASWDMPPPGTPAPDLLIADYHLGSEDGLAVVASLRQRYPDTAFPVIIITGDTTSAGMQTLQNSGCHVLHKPVRPARLRALVTYLLRRDP
jgi:signal transduction histidine kinase/CheY-like chemotaxis protein